MVRDAILPLSGSPTSRSPLERINRESRKLEAFSNCPQGYACCMLHIASHKRCIARSRHHDDRSCRHTTP